MLAFMPSPQKKGKKQINISCGESFGIHGRIPFSNCQVDEEGIKES